MVRKFCYTLLAGLCAGALTLTAAQAAPIQIKFPYKVAANTLRGQSVAAFGESMKQATGGKYEVIPYPNGSLYTGSAAANAVQLGIVQMTNEPNSAFAGYTKLLNLSAVPFAWPTPKEFRKFMDSASGQAMLETLSTRGFEGLALMDEGPMIIATKKQLVKSPADLKGKKIRTSGHQIVIEALKAMGASTVKISFPEVYSALQQGVIDGVYTTFDAYTKAKMYEVAPNVMLFPTHGMYIWVANKAWFQQQPKDVQADIRKFSKQQADKYFDDVWGDLKQYVSVLKQHGGHYYEPDQQSVKEFRKAIQPVYAHLKKQYGANVIDAILAGKTLSVGELTASR
ncbi:MAG TPA: TRAP transporter substrate-binding protein [Burkholderiales bacterium]|nr:TRAP transporter substrate-binding protein [Burkholderiales bacterium]